MPDSRKWNGDAIISGRADCHANHESDTDSIRYMPAVLSSLFTTLDGPVHDKRPFFPLIHRPYFTLAQNTFPGTAISPYVKSHRFDQLNIDILRKEPRSEWSVETG